MSDRRFLKEMHKFFPDRWEVSKLKRIDKDDKAEGTVRIRCTQDKKIFLSDFEAKLDSVGRILELNLDGVTVGKYLGRHIQESS